MKTGAVGLHDYSVKNSSSKMCIAKNAQNFGNTSLMNASASQKSKNRSRKKRPRKQGYPAPSLLSDELDMEQTVTAMINFVPVGEEDNYSKKGGTGVHNMNSRGGNGMKDRFKIFSSFNLRKKSANLMNSPHVGRMSAEIEERRNLGSRNQFYMPNIHSSDAKKETMMQYTK